MDVCSPTHRQSHTEISSSTASLSNTYTRDCLERDMLSLQSEINRLLTQYTSPQTNGITYECAQAAGRLLKLDHYFLRNTHVDYFIHAVKKGDSSDQYYDGDKFHFSINCDQAPEAFEQISPYLLSEQNPFSHWKMTDLDRYPRHERLYIGGQITLYAATDTKDNTYSAEMLASIKSFIRQLETTLNEANITPGVRPSSDVSQDDWHFCSYRNEFRSSREAHTNHQHELLNEPFFKVLL